MIQYVYNYKSEVNQENNEFYMENLYEDIENSFGEMRQILSNVGSSSDTIESRRKFAFFQIEVNQKLVKAAKESVDLSLDIKYLHQVQQKADDLKNLVETAIQSFTKYTPYISKTDENTIKIYSNSTANSSETTPLLALMGFSSSSPPSSYLDSANTSYGTNVSVSEMELENEQIRNAEIEQIRNAENVEDGRPNLSEIQSMQNIFDVLYSVIREQELLSIQSRAIQNQTENAGITIQTARIQYRRDRRNMVCGLVLCLVTLAIVVTYIYFRFIYFKL